MEEQFKMAHFFSSYIIMVNVPLLSFVTFPGVMGSGSISSFSCHYILMVLSFFCQGQMLTLVEYLLLLYRALLPTPVWYRFFLNKGYESLFSSLMTGLYLTFKLTSVVEKVCWFLKMHVDTILF